LLDRFPTRRGAVVSLGSFLALVLNAVTAVAVVPVIGGSALGFATAALVGVGAGQLLWAWHCAVEDRDCAVSREAAELEPTEML
ncbi:Bcr/CflA family drug resistance efflux transporter, partial [Legionella pneumophila]